MHNTIPKRYIMAGQSVTRRVPKVMAARGLESHIEEWIMTVNADRVWLFAVLNPRTLERLERYTDKALIHHLVSACDGTLVFISNTDGLRYGFLLSRRPRLPKSVDFPGCKRGVVRLGLGPTGHPVAVRWEDVGHILMAGMTGSGKSNALRLLVHQAIGEGARLLLADLDGATFPMLRGDSTLLAPIADTPEGAREIVSRALAECDRRAALYQSIDGYPDKLAEYNAAIVKAGEDPLPRVLCVLDEFNATVTALGGHRGQFSRDVAQLGWRGRKFGVNLVFAAQDFTKAVIGRVRDQVKTTICFKVRGVEVARAIGCGGAARIPESRPGRALTDRWGPVQIYRFDKSLLVNGTPNILSETESVIVMWAIKENSGYLSLADIQAQAGIGQSAARRLASDWERRGWLQKNKDRGNKRRITPELAVLATNHNPHNPLQTATGATNRPTNRPSDEPSRPTPPA